MKRVRKQFDAIIRSLTSESSRRGVLRGVIGGIAGALTGLLAHEAVPTGFAPLNDLVHVGGRVRPWRIDGNGAWPGSALRSGSRNMLTLSSAPTASPHYRQRGSSTVLWTPIARGDIGREGP